MISIKGHKIWFSLPTSYMACRFVCFYNPLSHPLTDPGSLLWTPHPLQSTDAHVYICPFWCCYGILITAVPYAHPTCPFPSYIQFTVNICTYLYMYVFVTIYKHLLLYPGHNLIVLIILCMLILVFGRVSFQLKKMVKNSACMVADLIMYIK